jgi:hypothetical protein
VDVGISGAGFPDSVAITALHSDDFDHLNEIGAECSRHVGFHQLSQVYWVYIWALLVNA